MGSSMSGSPLSGATADASVQAKFPLLAAELLDGTLNVDGMPLPLLLSGACTGADETFGAAALAAGHGAVHFLCAENEPSERAAAEQGHCLYQLSNDLLEHEAVVAAVQTAGQRRLAKSQLVPGWESNISASRRNFFQVRRASSVYAVGWRLAEGMEAFAGRTELPDGEKGPALDVGGGTGWACQWYADRFGQGGEDPSLCRLYFFDDGGPPFARKDEATSQRWSSWDVAAQKWVPLAGRPPAPAGVYAGIGASRLADTGIAAIASLYASPAPSAA